VRIKPYSRDRTHASRISYPVSDLGRASCKYVVLDGLERYYNGCLTFLKNVAIQSSFLKELFFPAKGDYNINALTLTCMRLVFLGNLILWFNIIPSSGWTCPLIFLSLKRFQIRRWETSSIEPLVLNRFLIISFFVCVKRDVAM
jgi:hypothetical protein